MFPSWSNITHNAIERKLAVNHLFTVSHVQILVKFRTGVHNKLQNLTAHPLYCLPVGLGSKSVMLPYMPWCKPYNHALDLFSFCMSEVSWLHRTSM